MYSEAVRTGLRYKLSWWDEYEAGAGRGTSHTRDGVCVHVVYCVYGVRSV